MRKAKDIATRNMLFCGVAACAIFFSEANAQTIAISVPEQTLSESLKDVGRQTGQNLLFTSNTVSGKRGKALNGKMTAEEAVGVLIEGTDMEAVSDGARGLIVRRRLAANDVGQQRVAAAAPEAAPIVAAAPPAVATTGLGGVVVTARRKEERLQTVPVAVSVVSQATIDAKGNYSALTLQQDVVGFHMFKSPGAGGDPIYFTMRGQTQANQSNFPAVIPYFAETPITRGLTEGHFFDLENVQVLRGAQGVRFGRVTDGGAILLSPKRPDDEFGGFIGVKVGNYNLNQVNGALNVPIVKDKLLLRAAFDSTRRDGYTENLVSGRDLDDVDYNAGRLSVIFRPSDRFENYTSVNYQNTMNNGTGLQLINFNGSSLQFQGISANAARFAACQCDPALGQPSLIALANQAVALNKQLGPSKVYNGDLLFGPDAGVASHSLSWTVSNITTFELNENVTFKNIFGYGTFRQRQAVDTDGTGLLIINLPNQGLTTGDYAQWSEEFQVRFSLFDKALDWTIGLYTDRQDPFHSFTQSAQFYSTDLLTYLESTASSKAVYTAAEYDLSKVLLSGLKLNGGVRYTEDETSGDNATFNSLFSPGVVNPAPRSCAGNPVFVGSAGPQSCIHNSQASHALTWEAGATYQPTQNAFFYVSARRGYRPGGINKLSVPGFNTYGPEETQEVELGMKADWNVAGMPARTNIALYHSDISEIQQSLSFVVNGVSLAGISNAVDATVRGIEFEGQLVPVEGLTLGLNYAFTDAQFDKNPALQVALFDPVRGVCNISAPAPALSPQTAFCPYNRFPSTPKHQAQFSVNYRLPLSDDVGSIAVGGELNYTTKQAIYIANFQDPHAFQKTHAELNLHATWTQIFGRPIDAALFLTNATDVRYYVGGLPSAKLGIDTVSWNPPRMFGASLKYRFGADS